MPGEVAASCREPVGCNSRGGYDSISDVHRSEPEEGGVRLGGGYDLKIDCICILNLQSINFLIIKWIKLDHEFDVRIKSDVHHPPNNTYGCLDKAPPLVN